MHIQQEYDAFPERAAGPGHFEKNSAKTDSRRDRWVHQRETSETMWHREIVRSQRKHGLIKKKKKSCKWEQPRNGSHPAREMRVTQQISLPQYGKNWKTLRSPYPEEITAGASTAASDGEKIERKWEKGS